MGPKIKPGKGGSPGEGALWGTWSLVTTKEGSLLV